MITNIIIQEEADFCVCSVLQKIFMKYNKKISQEEIAKNLTPGKERGFMIHDLKINRFMKKNGLDYTLYWHDKIPFNEPDFLLEEMNENSGFIAINTHVYYLMNFKYPNIKIIDPKNAQIIEKNLYQCLKEMKKSEGCFGLVKNIEK